MPSTIDPLQTVLAAKAGQKLTVKTALLQNSHYKQETALVRSTWAAVCSLKPEMSVALETLQSSPALPAIEKIVSQLLPWRNSLRAGGTDAVEQALLKVLTCKATEAVERKDLEQLSSLVRLIGVCKSLPSSPRSTLTKQYTEVFETCNKAYAASSQAERQQRMQANLTQVAEIVKGKFDNGQPGQHSTADFCRYTRENIKEIWVDRDGVLQTDLDTSSQSFLKQATKVSSCLLECEKPPPPGLESHECFTRSSEAPGTSPRRSMAALSCRSLRRWSTTPTSQQKRWRRTLKPCFSGKLALRILAA